MDSKDALLAFAALSQATHAWTCSGCLWSTNPMACPAGERLRGPLAVPANTMSAHLAVLARAGLVSAERHSRSIVYRAEVAASSRADRLPHEGLLRGANPRFVPPSAILLRPSPCIGNLLNHRRQSPWLTASTTSSSCAPATRPAPSWRKASCARTAAGASTPFSAGSQPKGAVNPARPEGTGRFRLPDGTVCARKAVSEFAGPDAPVMDFVLHGLRQCRRRGLPGLAGPADDGPLGHRGPGRRRRHRYRERARFRPGSPIHQEPHQRLHGAADEEPRSAGARHEAA